MSSLKAVYVEGITREELIEQFISLQQRLTVLEGKIEVNVQQELTLDDLCDVKGYSKAQLRKIITARRIPFSFRNGRLVVSRENAKLITPKRKKS